MQLQHLIGGKWTSGNGEVVEDRDPGRPDESVASYRATDAEQARAAVSAAQAAFDGWRKRTLHERAEILERAASLIDSSSEQWGRELTREEGKTLPEGVGEVRRAADVLRYFAAEADQEQGHVYASPRAGETIYVIRRPVGPVVAITPFNFPIFIPALKIAPALLYGNTVVLKPAPHVPLLAHRFVGALLEAGVPDGVLNLVYGDAEVVHALLQAPNTRAVSFTGSTAVGRSIMQVAAGRGIPVQAEMGGKNPVVLADDAPIDLAIEKIVYGAMGSSGQKCTGTSRVILYSQRGEEVVQGVVEATKSLAVGYGLDPGVAMGPVISEQARASVHRWIDDALASGATALAGGTRYESGTLAQGFFVPPTVLEVDPSHAIAQQEVFGPVLAVLRARDFEDAIRLANTTEFGLSASVFTHDLGKTLQALRDLDAGVIHINSETTGADPHVPVGGTKSSSSRSRELGRLARDFYTASVTAYVRDSEPLP